MKHAPNFKEMSYEVHVLSFYLIIITKATTHVVLQKRVQLSKNDVLQKIETCVTRSFQKLHTSMLFKYLIFAGENFRGVFRNRSDIYNGAFLQK